jgi:hypothetical protein
MSKGDLIAQRENATGFVYMRDERWRARLRRWFVHRVLRRPDTFTYGVASAAAFTFVGKEGQSGHIVAWPDTLPTSGPEKE